MDKEKCLNSICTSNSGFLPCFSKEIATYIVGNLLTAYRRKLRSPVWQGELDGSRIFW